MQSRKLDGLLKLLLLAKKKGLEIRLIDFMARDGMLYDKKIGLDSNLILKDVTKILAHEIAHAYLHKGKGDTVDNPKHKEYEEEADRASQMVLDLLQLETQLEL